MKFKLLLTLLTTVLLTAEENNYIYKDLYFNQDISTIDDIKEINNSTFPNSVKPYFLEKEHITLLVKDEKLKIVNLSLDKFVLKDEIENKLKNGFRLKSIHYKNKFNAIPIKNVGELLQAIDSDLSRSEIFDVVIDSNLIFKNELDNILLVMELKIAVERDAKKCKICTELNGKTFNEVRLLDLFYTKINE